MEYYLAPVLIIDVILLPFSHAARSFCALQTMLAVCFNDSVIVIFSLFVKMSMRMLGTPQYSIKKGIFVQQTKGYILTPLINQIYNGNQHNSTSVYEKNYCDRIIKLLLSGNIVSCMVNMILPRILIFILSIYCLMLFFGRFSPKNKADTINNSWIEQVYLLLHSVIKKRNVHPIVKSIENR